MKTKYWIVMIITAGIVMDDKRFNLLLKFFWAGLCFSSILAFFQVMDILPMKNGFAGFGLAYTFTSVYLIVGMLTVSFSFKTAVTEFEKFYLFVLFVLFLFHLAVLRGRGGYLMFLIVSPVLATNLLHKFSVKLKIALSIILMCSLFLSPIVRDRVKSTVLQANGEKGRILKGERIDLFPRPHMIKIAIDVIKENPWIGIGTGSLSGHPHNDFLYMWTSFGLFGVIPFLWLLWKMFKISWNKRNEKMGFFVLSSLAAFFLSGMLDTQIVNTSSVLFFALTYAMLKHLINSPEEIPPD